MCGLWVGGVGRSALVSTSWSSSLELGGQTYSCGEDAKDCEGQDVFPVILEQGEC